MYRKLSIVLVLIVINVIYSRYDVSNRSHLHRKLDGCRGYFSPLMLRYYPALSFNDEYLFKVNTSKPTTSTLTIKCIGLGVYETDIYNVTCFRDMGFHYPVLTVFLDGKRIYKQRITSTNRWIPETTTVSCDLYLSQGTHIISLKNTWCERTKYPFIKWRDSLIVIKDVRL